MATTERDFRLKPAMPKTKGRDQAKDPTALDDLKGASESASILRSLPRKLESIVATSRTPREDRMRIAAAKIQAEIDARLIGGKRE